MIGKQIMAWLRSRFTTGADKRLDATITASLLANARVANAAADVRDSAEMSQAWMENVAFDARRRVQASAERRSNRQSDPHLKVIAETMRIMENRS